MMTYYFTVGFVLRDDLSYFAAYTFLESLLHSYYYTIIYVA